MHHDSSTCPLHELHDARVLRVHHTCLQQQTKCSIFLQCSLQRSKNGRVVKSKLPSLDTSDLACKPKNMSNPDNLTKASWTIFIQARGLDKLVTLLLVKATTLDIRQSSTLDNLFRTQISLELEGLMYCPESTK